MTDEKPTCELCGEPMPAGEEMFKYHGYSGDCPKPPKPAPMNPEAAEAIRIADKHLAGASIERRKALALDIQEAIVKLAGEIAVDAISTAFAKARAHASAVST